MEAGPRDTAHEEQGQVRPEAPGALPADDPEAQPADGPDALSTRDALPSQDRGMRPAEDRNALPAQDRSARPAEDRGVLHDSGGETLHDADGGVVPDGPDPEEEAAALAASEVEVELRPQRKLRIWQIAPIVVLATLGSLMFAFPLAFAFDDGGAVVAMLGLLISCCAAGWGVMAARRVGHTWPGLPARGSGHRPDWRVVLTYTAVVGVLAVLAVWRVARLR